MERRIQQTPRFWQKGKPVEVPVRTYRCPICGEVLFSVSYNARPVPDEYEIVTCPSNPEHKIKVPKYTSKVF